MRLILPNRGLGKAIDLPGIAPETVFENGVRRIETQEAVQRHGIDASGLLIPYRRFGPDGFEPIIDPEEKEFARVRKDRADEFGKYRQATGSDVHLYIPVGTESLLDGANTFLLTEGEKKGVVPTDLIPEAALPAAGMSGFFGFRRKDKQTGELTLVPEFQQVLDRFHGRRVVFLLDNDAVLNWQAYLAAAELRHLLPGYEIVFLCLPPDGPKGLDDCRAAMNGDFERFFRRQIDSARLVTADDTPESLALDLAPPALDVLEGMSPGQRAPWTKRILRMLYQSSPAVQVGLLPIAAKALGVGATALGKQINAQKSVDQKRKNDLESKLVDDLWSSIQHIQFDGKLYHAVGEADVRSFAREDMLLELQLNCSARGPGIDEVSAARVALNVIQNRNRVAWAGPVGGRPVGVYLEGGKKFVVTDGARLLESADSGDASVVVEILADLMGRGVDPCYPRQLVTLLDFLRSRRAALQSPNSHLPGPILALVGPEDCGKGFAVDEVLAPILGGGLPYNPYDEWCEGRFTAEITAANMLHLSDPEVDPRFPKLTKVRNLLFETATGQFRRSEAKGKAPIQLRPIQTVVVTMNPVHGSFHLLDLTSSDRMGKVLLLKCYPVPCLPGHDGDERNEFLKSVQAALPAFLGQLMQREAPNDAAARRFGVVPWRHPELMAMATGLESWKVAGLLESKLEECGDGVLEGTASEHKERFGELYEGSTAALGPALAYLQKVPWWSSRIDHVTNGYDNNNNEIHKWSIRADLS